MSPPVIAKDSVILNTEKQLDSVSTLISLNEYDKALAYLKDIPPTQQKEIRTQQQLSFGKIYFHQGFFDKALLEFEQALVLHGSSEDLLLADINSWIGSCHLRFTEFDKATEFYNKTLSIRKRLLGDKHEKVGYVYNNLGIIAEDKGLFEEAIAYYKQSLEIIIANNGTQNADVADAYLKIGDAHRMMKNYAVANGYAHKALAILQEKFGATHINTSYVYYNLGLLHSEMGNHKKGLSYISKMAGIFEKVYGTDHQKVNYLKYLMAVSYIKMEQYDKAEGILKTVITHYLKREEEGYYLVAMAYQYLGEVYLATEDRAKGLNFYDKALQTYQQKFSDNHHYTYECYLSLGNALCKAGEEKTALRHLEKALRIGQDIFKKNPIKLSPAYIALGRTCLNVKDRQQARKYLQQAHTVLGVSEASRDVPYLHGEIVEVELQMVRLLIADYQEDGNLASLYQVDSLLNSSERRLDYLKRHFQSIESGQSLSTHFYKFYQYGLDVNYLLHQATKEDKYLNRAFEYSEKSKTFTLMRTLQNEEALQIAGIPDSVVNHCNKLSAEISYKEKLLFEAGQAIIVDQKLVHRLNSDLFDVRANYETLLKQIETAYPEYYQLKYNLKPVTIANVQQQLLTADQSLVAYFVGDTSIYVFIIDKESKDLLQLPKKQNLAKDIQQFRNSIYKYRPYKREEKLIKDYARLGHILYKDLIAPFQAKLKPRTTIIASGMLEYLPFDALVLKVGTDIERFRDYEYMIDKHALSYVYSASWLQTIKAKEKVAYNRAYLGIAPGFSGQTSILRGGGKEFLSELKYNTKEVAEIQTLIGGEVLPGAAATKCKFEATAGDCQVLHLATHGKSNNEAGNYSFLAFSESPDSTENSLFYVKDLQNLHIPAELVVLSACETGLGELQKGEGVVSVGKGFSYAGARSILTTLWQVNDNTTAKLMPLFYKYLQKGYSKEVALQQAKKAFIASNRNAHPFYWSGYLIFGDMEKMDLKKPSPFWMNGLLGTLGLGIIGSLLFWWFKIVRIEK